MKEFKVFYFGWKRNYGHGFNITESQFEHMQVPWQDYEIDGKLAPHGPDCSQRPYCSCPHRPALQGQAIRHERRGWTLIAFWDRSGDERPNSNTAFFCHAVVPFDALLAMAQVQYPEIFSRFQNFSVQEYRGWPLPGEGPVKIK